MVTFLEGLVSKASAGTTVQYKMGFLLDRKKPNPIDWSTGEAASADATVIHAGISGLIEGEERGGPSHPIISGIVWFMDYLKIK